MPEKCEFASIFPVIYRGASPVPLLSDTPKIPRGYQIFQDLFLCIMLRPLDLLQLKTIHRSVKGKSYIWENFASGTCEKVCDSTIQRVVGLPSSKNLPM